MSDLFKLTVKKRNSYSAALQNFNNQKQGEIKCDSDHPGHKEKTNIVPERWKSFHSVTVKLGQVWLSHYFTCC